MADNNLTRTQYLNALLRQKRQLQQSGMSVVNPSLTPLASIDTSFQTGVDKTNVPTEAEVKQTTKPKQNWWDQMWGNIFGFVDEITSKVKGGVFGAVEGVLDLGATALGALGDSTGWYEGAGFTEWAEKDIGTAMAEFNKTYGLSFGSIYNLFTGQYNFSDAFNSAGDFLSGVFTDADLKDMREDADKNYAFNDDVLEEMGGVGEFLGGAAHAIGFMLPAIATGGIAGGSQAVTLGTMFLSGAGKSSEQALKEGAESEKALLYGIASGAVETASEVLVGKFLGTAAKALHLDDLAKGFGKINGIEISKNLVQKSTAKQLMASMFEEGAEEVVSGILAPFLETIYKGDKAFYNENGENIFTNSDYIKEIGTAFLSGAFVSGIMGGANNINLIRKYGKEGVSFIEKNRRHNELLKEYERMQFAKEDTTEIEQEMKELTGSILNSLETLSTSSNKKHIRNLMLDYAKSTQKIKKNQWSEKETQRMVENFKSSFEQPVYKKFTEDINKVLRQKGLKNKIVWATDSELREGLNSQVETYNDAASQTPKGFLHPDGYIVINEKYSKEVGSIIKHELIGHAILDTNEAARKSLIKFIENDPTLSKEFHSKDEQLKKHYSSQELDSERLAFFLENYVADFDKFEKIFQEKPTLKSKMITILKHVKRALLRNEKVIDKKILESVEETLDSLTQEPKTVNTLPDEEPVLKFSKVLNKDIVSSPIPFQGSKFELMEQILAILPPKEQVKRFVDVFGGTLTVSMNVDYPKRIANELHPMLHKLYNSFLYKNGEMSTREFVRTYLQALAAKHSINQKEGYDALKRKYNAEPKEEKNALELYLLVKYGTSGTFLDIDSQTYDFKGNFSPRNANPNWSLVIRKINNFRKKLKNVKIGTFDCIKVIDNTKEGDFLYCDPPYILTNATYNEGWSEKDDIRLMEALDNATERGVKFALSNVLSYNGKTSKKWTEWANKYRTSHLEKSYKKGKADEVLICNYTEKGEIINVAKETREKYRRYTFNANDIKPWVNEGDIQVYLNKEWKGLYEKARPKEKQFLTELYEGKISIFSEKGKYNLGVFYDALEFIKNKAYDKEGRLKYKYWTPEMKMLYDEIRKVGIGKLSFVRDQSFTGEYLQEENSIVINLLAISQVDSVDVQRLIRHERSHFIEKKYPSLHHTFAKQIFEKIDSDLYGKLKSLDNHANDYVDLASKIVKQYGQYKLNEINKTLLSQFKGIKLPFSVDSRSIVLFSDLMIANEVLADIYAQKPDRIAILKKILPVNEINTIVNSVDLAIEKDRKVELKFSKVLTGAEVDATTVKSAAEETVVDLDDTQDVVDSIYTYIKTFSPTIVLPNKTKLSRMVFNKYNLKSKKDKIKFLTSVVEELFETKQPFAITDPMDSTKKIVVNTSIREFLDIEGYASSAIIVNTATNFYTLLDKRSKISTRQQALIELKLMLNKIQNDFRKYKRWASEKFKAYKQVIKIKDEIKGLTGLKRSTSDTRVDELDFINKMFDKGWFTTIGNFSGQFRKRAYELTIKDENGLSYFDKLRAKIEKEGTPLPLEVIEFYEEIGKTYVIPTKENPNIRQKTMNLEETQKFVAIAKMIRKTYQEYVNGIYADVEMQATTGAKKFNIIAEILEKSRNSLSFNTLKVTEKFINPISVMRVAGVDTKFIEDNFINPFISAYSDKRAAQTNLVKTFRQIISDKAEIFRNANKKVNFDDKRISRFNLYSLYLNLSCEYNGINVVSAGCTIVENNGQRFTIKPRVKQIIDETKTRKQIEIEQYALNEQARLEMLEEVKKSLTAKEIQELEALSDFLNKGELKEYAKKSQMKIDGFTTLLDDRYYPVTIDDAAHPINVGKRQSSNFTVDASNVSFLKNRTGARSKVRLSNPIMLIEAYIDSISTYGEITQRLKKIQRIFNKKVVVDGVKTNLLAEIERYTPDFRKHYVSFVSKILGIDVSRGREIWDWMMGKYSTAVLGVNIGSMLTQVASLPTAMNLTKIRNALKAMTKKSFYSPKKIYDDHKWLMNEKNIEGSGNGIYAWRVTQHGYIKGLTTSNQFHQTFNRILNKATDISLLGMEKLDQLWCLLTFQFAQETVATENPTKFPLGSEENKREASKLFSRILLETQSNSDPIAKSMLRSGELGKMTQYLFGVFASDAQAKSSLFVENLVNFVRSKKIKTKLKEMMDKNDYKTFDKEEVEALYKELDQKNYSAGLSRYFATLMVSSLLSLAAGLLRDMLYGRKEPEDLIENPWDEIGLPFLIENIEWIPVFGQFMSYFKYESMNIMPLQTTVTIIEQLIQLNEGLSNGTLSNGALTNLLIQIGQFFGIPLNNLKNIFMGLLTNFNPELAIETDNLLYGRSQNYFVGKYFSYADKGKNNKAKATLKEYLSAYKLNVEDDKIIDELNTLYKLKYQCLPKNGPTSFTNENGEEIKISSADLIIFNQIYELSNTAVSKLVVDSQYKNSTPETRSKIIKKIYDTYYEVAYASIRPTTKLTRMAQWLAENVENPNVMKYFVVLQKIAEIASNGAKTRKELVFAYVNSLSGFSKAEKLEILALAGYTIKK